MSARRANWSDERVHDVVAIGLGPFNLGLACLADPVEDLSLVVLEAREGFSWHPGLLLDEATIQVPFMADLVTMADPTSRFSFLAYLKEVGRLYPFYIRESFYPLRAEYDDYCRWAADRLDCVRFGHQVVAVEREQSPDGEPVYAVRSMTADGQVVHRGRHVVVGVGTAPWVPDPLRPFVEAQRGESTHDVAAGVDTPCLHTADYLHRREEVTDGRHVLVVGSGQSAAEIFHDLLLRQEQHGYHLTWVTRSPRFFPMEYTKLTLEMTSPEYTNYFHGLPAAARDRLGREQRSLYKGISGDLVDEIHDTLYRLGRTGPPPATLVSGTEVVGAEAAGGGLRITMRHLETGKVTDSVVDRLVAGTGYRPRPVSFLDPLGAEVRRDERGRLDVTRDFTVDGGEGRIFVQNAEEHTHGIIAPDLGMGAYRSSMILSRVLGREVYPVEERIAYQTFGPWEPVDALA
jgi:lysine N6-hydroxylase